MLQRIKNPKLMTEMEAKAVYADKFFVFLERNDSEFKDGRVVGFVPCVADTKKELFDEYPSLDDQDALIKEFGDVDEFVFGWMFGLDAYKDMSFLMFQLEL
ncbi:MAG: hypothetical protein LBL26_02300 [Peptococcaceae bacterium]|nr:hypothetical protein [Peptococcaceae bacterium]